MKRLAFLEVYEREKGDIFHSGLIVTDEKGVPIEVRWATLKVAPLQKILFGKSLTTSVTIDHLAIPLISGVEKKLSVIVVHRPELLNVRLSVDIPVYLVTPRYDSDNELKKQEYSVLPHDMYTSDLPQALELKKLFPTLDPAEVFARIPIFLNECTK